MSQSYACMARFHPLIVFPAMAFWHALMGSTDGIAVNPLIEF
ncbi:MAG: hypothetical protein AAGA53_16375 [Pseudomonadota bacterium]